MVTRNSTSSSDGETVKGHQLFLFLKTYILHLQLQDVCVIWQEQVSVLCLINDRLFCRNSHSFFRYSPLCTLFSCSCCDTACTKELPKLKLLITCTSRSDKFSPIHFQLQSRTGHKFCPLQVIGAAWQTCCIERVVRLRTLAYFPRKSQRRDGGRWSMATYQWFENLGAFDSMTFPTV